MTPLENLIIQSILDVHDVDFQFCGVDFLESLVSEFSPSTSSAMGILREFHVVELTEDVLLLGKRCCCKWLQHNI